MTDTNQKQLGNTLWSIVDQLSGAMDADDFRDYMLSFLFLRYLSDNYETAAKKELGRDYPDVGGDARKVPLALWYANNVDDIPEFESRCAARCTTSSSPHTCGTASPSTNVNRRRLSASDLTVTLLTSFYGRAGTIIKPRGSPGGLFPQRTR